METNQRSQVFKEVDSLLSKKQELISKVTVIIYIHYCKYTKMLKEGYVNTN